MMADTQQLLDTMVSRFNPSAAADMDEVFQYHIEDGGDYYLVIKQQNCELASGEHDDPSVSLTLDSDTLAEIMSGETDGMQAFMAGRIKAGGNMMLATRLNDLFPIT
jgi:putative sterol carrier protein